MSRSEERAGCFSSVLVILAFIGMIIVHLCLCYYVYKTQTFLAVFITFVLPVLAELFWLGVTLADFGFTWVHLLYCLCLVLYFAGEILPKITEHLAEARARRKERKRQEMEAERAAAQARRYVEFSPAAVAAIANRQEIDRRMAERIAAQKPVITPQQPVSQEEQLRRRADLAERRCQELSAELREQKAKTQAEILTVQIEDLERSLEINQALPPDGVADMQRELIEKKAQLFDLQRNKQ